MKARLPGRAWAAVACTLMVCGCSAAPEGRTRLASHTTGPLRLSPSPAFASAQLAVSFADPQMRTDDYQIEWRRNGLLISGAQSRVLDPSLIAKGDRIEVSLRPASPDGKSAVPLKAEVLVANTPPTLSRVAILSTGTSGHAELQATVSCADPDRDPVTYTYHWFRNGQPVEGANGASLAADPLAVGDQVAVEVVASDGEAESASLRSEPYRLENRPPHFTSAPAAPRPKDEIFRYQALATDPDGDPIRYELVSGPVGMTVDANGTVTWTLPTGGLRSGQAAVSIRAIDSKGDEATQQFTINLDSPSVAR